MGSVSSCRRIPQIPNCFKITVLHLKCRVKDLILESSITHRNIRLLGRYTHILFWYLIKVRVFYCSQPLLCLIGNRKQRSTIWKHHPDIPQNKVIIIFNIVFQNIRFISCVELYCNRLHLRIKLTGINVIDIGFHIAICSFIDKARPIARKDIKTMIGAALLIGVIRKVLLMYGLSRTSPIDGSIIDTITPLLVLLISVVLGIDKFTRLKIAGLVLGMAGAVGVVLLGASGGHTHSGLVGNLMIAGCALATSCYMVWFKKLIARYDVVTMLRWVYCLAALMVLPFGARELVHTDFAAMDTDILLATLFVVFVPTYVPNLLLNYSLKYVQPTVSSIYTYLQPVLAVILSVAMGLDRLHLDTALCALVIFFGVGLVIRSYRGPAVPSAPLPVHTH